MEEDKRKNKALKAKAKALTPVINIGKNGLTDSVLGEIELLLKKRKLIKIKMLESYFSGKDKWELAHEIAHKTNSTLIDAVGNVVVLYKR